VASDVGRGKPADRLTVGQQVEILRRLSKQCLIANQDCVSWQLNLDVLGRLVTRRNDFAHRRWGHDERDVEAVRALFADLRTFCNSLIITGVPKSRGS
jgi:hypothetical protein